MTNTTMNTSSMTTMTFLLLTLPPLLAFLYILNVWLIYSVNREIPWTSKGGSMTVRLSLLVASVAVAIGLSGTSAGNNDNGNNYHHHDQYYGVTLALLAALSWWAGICLIIQTRRRDVVGIDTVPFYGSSALVGKVIAVTGANSGVGKETAKQLYEMGATVLLLCRDEGRAQSAINDIVKAQGTNSTAEVDSRRLIFVPLDLGDFESVRTAVQEIRTVLEKVDQMDGVVVEEEDDDDRDGKSGMSVTKTAAAAANAGKRKRPKTIDALINNAGLMMGRQTSSKDGLELMMQANHLGHYLLTRLLLEEGLLRVADLAKKTEGNGNNNSGGQEVEGGQADLSSSSSPPSRVINLTSSTHEFVSKGFDFDDMFCDRGTRPFTLFGQYSMTKLANILMTKELARRYPPGVVSLAVHPGIVRTNVTSNMLWYWRLPNDLLGFIIATMQKTPTEGAYSTVYAAAAPLQNLPSNGSYIVNCMPYPPSAAAMSADDATRLWRVSADLVGLPP